jgi:hypothetical protein
MTKSYSKLNRKNMVLEPNLSRQRLSFKGPIPSKVLNLYYDQFVVDCSRLSVMADEVDAEANQLSIDYANDFSLVTPDYYIDADLSSKVYNTYSYYDHNQDEQTVNTESFLENLEFKKYGINSSIINLLNNKINMLEDLIGKKE